MDIALTEDLESFIRERVASGKYPSTTDVIRAGLRLLAEHENLDERRLEVLRAEIRLGLEDEAAGRVAPYDRAEIERLGRELLEKRSKAR